LAQGRFDAGVGTILELTDAQLALTQAQNTESQALADTGSLSRGWIVPSVAVELGKRSPTATSKKLMKRVVSLVVVAILVGGAVWDISTPRAAQRAQVPPVRVERGPSPRPSRPRAISTRSSRSGRSQVSGQIKDLMVDFNSIVKKDQVIARIDPDIFLAKVNQAKADVESARATVLTRRRRSSARAQTSRTPRRRSRSRRPRRRRRRSPWSTPSATRPQDRAVRPQAHRPERPRYITGGPRFGHRPGRGGQGARSALASAIQSSTAQLRVVQAMLVSARAQVDQKNAALKQAQVDLDHTTILAPVNGWSSRGRSTSARPSRRACRRRSSHDRPGPDEDAGRDERGRG